MSRVSCVLPSCDPSCHGYYAFRISSINPLFRFRRRFGGNQEEIDHLTAQMSGYGKLLVGRELNELPKVIAPDEHLTGGFMGANYADHAGLLIFTDRRVLFVHKGFVGGMHVVDFPYEKVTSIQYQTGLFTGTLTIFASGNKTDFTHAKNQ